jgi:hypothetical protein
MPGAIELSAALGGHDTTTQKLACLSCAKVRTQNANASKRVASVCVVVQTVLVRPLLTALDDCCSELTCREITLVYTSHLTQCMT